MQYSWSHHSPSHREPAIWGGYWPDPSDKRRDLLQRFFFRGRARHHRRLRRVPDDQQQIGPLVARTLKNLIQEFHRVWRMGERRDAQLMESIDQKFYRNAHRLRHVVMPLSRTLLIDAISPRKYNNQLWRRFQKRLGRIRAYFLHIIQPRLPRPTTIKFLLFLRRLADRTLGVTVTHAGKVPWLVVRTARR